MTASDRTDPTGHGPREALADSRVIFASAGSGKTFALTSRFLRLLASGEPVHSIIASTFTRSAAGEILERIVERLVRAGAGDLTDLREHVDPAMTPLRAREILRALLDDLHRLSVGTIDALLHRFASASALELDLAPGWRIVDEQHDARMRERALDLTLEGSPPVEMARTVEMLLGSARSGVRSSVLSQIGEALHSLMHVADDDAWERFAPDDTPMDDATLADAIESLRAMPIPMNKNGETNGHWRNAHRTCVSVCGRGEWEVALEGGLLPVALAPAGRYHGIEPGKAQIAALAPLARHARAEALHKHFRRSLARRDLVRAFDAHYAALKRQEGLLRFDDLVRMLVRARVMGDLRSLYERLDMRVRHVLLDEFQDTSLAQFSLLAPILDEVLAQDDGRSVLVVGDAKQSLYGWREAEPSLLECLPSRWERLREDTLDRSWRSSAVVLDVVNLVFASIDENPALAGEEASRRWQARFSPHEAARDLPGRVLLVECAPIATDDTEPDDDSDEDDSDAPDSDNPSAPPARLSDAMREGVESVAVLCARAPEASIGVIVRRNRVIRPIVDALRARGIDASEEGGSTLDDTRPNACALSMIQLALHPGDSASAFHVAASPLGDVLGLHDPLDPACAGRVAREARVRIDDAGLAPFLTRLSASLQSRMSADEAQRFDQLIDLAREFDAQGEASLDEFLSLVRARRVDAPGGARVRVMTIHRSKGLEFDAVVLCELDPSIEPRTQGILLDREQPLGDVTGACVCPNRMLRSLDPRLNEAFQRFRQRALEEAISQLYVAMTRARFALVMIVPGASKNLSHAKILRAALAPGAGGPILYEAGDDDWSSRATDVLGDAKIEPDRGTHAEDPARASETASFELRLRARPEPRAARLETRSPTESDMDLRRLLGAGSDVARRAGTLWHLWLQQVEWIDSFALDDDDLREIARREGFADEMIAEHLPRFRASLGVPEVRAVLSRPAGFGGVRLWRERAFLVPLHDALLSGRFDRVHVHLAQDRPDSAHILDFKADAGGDRAPGAIMARYASQLRAYREAAAALLGIGMSRARCSLILLPEGRVLDQDIA